MKIHFSLIKRIYYLSQLGNFQKVRKGSDSPDSRHLCDPGIVQCHMCSISPSL